MSQRTGKESGVRVYGYVRSGNHLLMQTLWATFFKNRFHDYRNLFGGHFDSAGDLVSVVANSIGITRNCDDVFFSVWKMRKWFGLTEAKSLKQFMKQPLSDSFEQPLPTLIKVNFSGTPDLILSSDALFANISLRPERHHAAYNDQLKTRCRVVVSYEALVSHPDRVVLSLCNTFGWAYREPQLPKWKVGFSVGA